MTDFIKRYKPNSRRRKENEETVVIMASEDSKDGSSRGKKDKKILNIFGGKAASLLGRAKEDMEKAVDKVKNTADESKEGIQSNAEKVADKVKDSAERAKEGIGNIKDLLFHKKHSDHDLQPETEKAEEDSKAKAETGETSKLESTVASIKSVVAFIQPKKVKVEEEIKAAVADIQPKNEGDTPPTEEKEDSVPSTEEEKVSVPPSVTDIAPVPATAPATEKEDFWESLGKWLENCCSVFKSKKD